MDLEFIIFVVAAATGVGLFSYLFYAFRPGRRDEIRLSRRKNRVSDEPPRYF